jgi:RNA polymerase sigma factor (sigma-70 family)
MNAGPKGTLALAAQGPMERCGMREHLLGMHVIAPGATVGRSVVELAAEGDEVAFARLVAAHHADMVRVAYVITADDALAQDAVQSAWMIAWRKIGSVRDPILIDRWLISVAANEARQVARRRRRVQVVEIDPAAPATRRSDPAVGIARLDLVRALARLSPDDRSLIALRYHAVSEGLADRLGPVEAPAPRVRSPRPLEDGIGGEMGRIPSRSCPSIAAAITLSICIASS